MEKLDFQKEKKRNYDKKFYLKKSGTYQPTRLEQVKELVKSEGLDISELCH